LYLSLTGIFVQQPTRYYDRRRFVFQPALPDLVAGFHWK
jgi:hypothetical protein